MQSEKLPKFEPQTALSLISDLIERLEAANIDYCHWKSNATLDEALLGSGDLDLLVSNQSATGFQAILFDLGFKLIQQPRWAAHASIYHYFGLDEATGKIVHVHAYFRLITGGVLQKNFHLPLEQAMLGDQARNSGVRVPTVAAELAAMTMRKMYEAATVLELTLLKLDWKHVRSEVDWLLSESDQINQATIEESYELVRRAFPTLQRQTYKSAIKHLQQDSSWFELRRIGKRVSKETRSHSLRSSSSAFVGSLGRAVVRVVNKLRQGKTPAKRLFTAGKVIAVVGPEASGKSTVTSHLTKWIGKMVDVSLVHTGKPKAGFLTWLPNRLVGLLRKFRRNEQFKRHETAGATVSSESNSLPTNALMLHLYALRSWWLAHDRYRAVTRAHRQANMGKVVVCDRYPTATAGAMDSPRLLEFEPRIRNSKWLSWLSRAEQRLYQLMPRADLVIRLSVPVDLAVTRNRERIKADKEGEQFVRLRHAKWEQQEFDCQDIVTIDTNQDMERVLSEIRTKIWQRL